MTELLDRRIDAQPIFTISVVAGSCTGRASDLFFSAATAPELSRMAPPVGLRFQGRPPEWWRSWSLRSINSRPKGLTTPSPRRRWRILRIPATTRTGLRLRFTKTTELWVRRIAARPIFASSVMVASCIGRAPDSSFRPAMAPTRLRTGASIGWCFHRAQLRNDRAAHTDFRKHHHPVDDDRILLAT